MSKRILYQSDYELRALRGEGKSLIEVQHFQVNNNGETEFAEYLSYDSKTPIYWLVDTSQEDYRATLLPHVLGKDRHDLMRLKMKRLFERTPYTYGIVQEREKLGRRDDRVLFTALSNPSFLQPWLDLIISHKVPLVGIFSVPLLSQRLLKHFPKASYMLLVTPTLQISAHSPAGLRQSFFVRQNLQFSRLIPLNIPNPQESTKYVLTQIIATQRYLENARLLPDTEPLSVIFLANTSQYHAFDQSLDYDASTLNIQTLDTHEFAQQLGLQYQREHHQNGELAFYLHHFVAFQLSHSWYTKNHYAKLAELRYLLYRRVRMGLYLTSGLLLAGAATASTMILEKASQIRQQGETTVMEIAKRQAELKQLRKQEPRNLPNLQLIRSVVDTGDYIEARYILPRPAWEKLSHVLNLHPDLLIERLEWGIGHTAAEIFQTDSQFTQTEKPDIADDSTYSSKDSSVPKFFLEGMRLHGKIIPFKGYPNALDTFRQFQNDLQKGKHFSKIQVLKSPYNPSGELQGQIGSQTEEGTKKGKAPFVIDIFIKHSYPKKIL